MLHIAIVGTGGISPEHIKGYLAYPDQCQIVALCDIVPEKAHQKAKTFNLTCDVVADYHELLEREDIDLIDVCTPPYVHAQISIDALDHGKHVVCEKPMAASLEECDAVLVAAKRSGKVFSPIAQNRFRRPIAAFKDLLDSGEAGALRHFSVDSLWWRGHCYYDMWWRGTWEKEGGGCTLNHAVHHIDMLGWMLGLPEEVTSVMTNAAHDNAEVEDLSVSVMRYKNMLATVTASVVHHGERQGLQAQCADAGFSVPFSVHASKSKGNGFPQNDPDLENRIRERFERFPPLAHEGHTGQIGNVLSAIEQNNAPAITGDDGRRTIEIITAIYKAGTTCQPVTLPLRPDDDFYTVAGIQKRVPHFYEKSVSLSDLSGEAITVGSDYGKKEDSHASK